MTRPELKAKAQAAFAETRAEMERLARTYPVCDLGSQQQAIECALARELRAARPARRARAARPRDARRSDRFRPRQGLRRHADRPVLVVTMPTFNQGNSVAYDDPPGALERDQPNFYTVSPIPADWTDEQATSFLTEYNLYMLTTCRSTRRCRALPAARPRQPRDRPAARGAAIGAVHRGLGGLSERVMAEQGYLGGEATEDGKLFKLTMLKMRLRSITNTLLDIGIQTEGMTREQAMELMMKGAFQQEREARASGSAPTSARSSC
jgi:hypothetical protein